MRETIRSWLKSSKETAPAAENPADAGRALGLDMAPPPEALAQSLKTESPSARPFTSVAASADVARAASDTPGE